MLNTNDVALVATLFNGKRVLIEPNYHMSRIVYRYLSGDEIDINKLDLKKKCIWYNSPLYTTVEKGETLVFATIEATPVVLNRF